MASINFNAAEVEPSQEFQVLPEVKYEVVIADSDVKVEWQGVAPWSYEIVLRDNKSVFGGIYTRSSIGVFE